MCEDRAMQLNRGIRTRLNRARYIRLRNRLVRIQRPAVPAQNPERVQEFPMESAQMGYHMSHIPMPLEGTVPASNIHLQRIQRFEMLRKHISEPWNPAHQMRRDNIMEIAMRTVMLIRQNQQLQQKLAALQAETKIFMKSVMNNPENAKSAAQSSMVVFVPKVELSKEEIKVESPKEEIKVESVQEEIKVELPKEEIKVEVEDDAEAMKME